MNDHLEALERMRQVLVEHRRELVANLNPGNVAQNAESLRKVQASMEAVDSAIDDERRLQGGDSTPEV